jgi:hypothetical protein
MAHWTETYRWGNTAISRKVVVSIPDGVIGIFHWHNPIGHILSRNCLLQRVTKGKIQGRIEVTGRQGRRRRKLLDDLKERRGYSHLKEEALDCTMWRARFGRGFGPVVRRTAKWMNPSGHIIALGSTLPPTEISTRNISRRVTAAGAWGWQPYQLHVLFVIKSGNLNLLEPSGLLKTCNGIV